MVLIGSPLVVSYMTSIVCNIVSLTMELGGLPSTVMHPSAATIYDLLTRKPISRSLGPGTYGT